MAVSRRGFIRVLGTSAVIVAGAGFGLTQCDPMPKEAVEGWVGPKPTDTDPRVRAIAFALLAPNPHNMQPWVVDLREPGAATFYCDRARLLPETDPYSRQIVIGCGAFIELLRMAAAEQGYRTDVALFPAGAWPDMQVGDVPLCRITFTADPMVARDPLLQFALSRRTARIPFTDQAIEAKEATALESATGDGVEMAWTSEPAKIARLKEIAEAAWRVEATTERTYLESVKVYRIGADEIARHRDGLYFHGPMMWWLKATGLFSQESAKEMGGFAHQSSIDFYIDWIKHTPSFIWMTTASNTRADQLASGRAYLRVNLKATELGLSMHPVSQALQEFPEMAGPMRDLHAALQLPQGHTAQMLVRVGHSGGVEPAPRRPVNDIVRT
jgi:hypothetical protein